MPGPTSATLPATSCPTMSGSLVIPANCFQSPSATCRSEWQTPLASTLINTSPSPGLGRSTSSITNGFFNSCKTAAFMGLPIMTSPDELRPGAGFISAPRADARHRRSLSKYFVHDFFDLLAQPAVRRIVFRTLMPIHVDLKLLQALERKRIKLVIESSIEHLRVMLGNGQQHVRLAHNAAR